MRRLSLIAVTLVVVAGCGSDRPTGGHDSTTTSSGSAATEAAAHVGEVGLVEDEPYYESADGTAAYIDIYYPLAAGDYPLVVLFHANPVLLGATKESVRALATMIAERGAVVVAPTWGHPMSMSDMHAIAREVRIWTEEQGPCAVWAAVNLASSVGADVSRVTLVGLTTGFLPAQAATFDPPTAADGCLSPPVPVPIEKAIMFESDWMLVPDIWDGVLASDPDYFGVSSVWDRFDTPSSTRIIMLAGEFTAPETVRSLEDKTYAESEWVRLRDPGGTFAEAFTSSGTLEDGSMSFTDVTEVVVALLVDGGWDAHLLIVPEAGHSVSSEAARAFVTEIVFSG